MASFIFFGLCTYIGVSRMYTISCLSPVNLSTSVSKPKILIGCNAFSNITSFAKKTISPATLHNPIPLLPKGTAVSGIGITLTLLLLDFLKILCILLPTPSLSPISGNPGLLGIRSYHPNLSVIPF
ncbi:hypothetical protein B9Z19DRAFT_1096076 [Tuber borchii]|uniref:Uncharacterized protein n=1 Tax=Tuber borchii TaxID=42251 RepID=A0A2T6ZBX2_TUBBO|nr:hypothetical protein B9Z19DRAFT_1096076 [Tuber borchii]